MTLPAVLQTNFRLPVVAAPLFIISHPPLVMAQCKAGVVGSFPALNARPGSPARRVAGRDHRGSCRPQRQEPGQAGRSLCRQPDRHMSNKRLEHDLTMCVKYKVPIVISSLGAVPEVNDAIHSYGGIVLHDIINNRHANSAIRKGADGLIAVAAGAGGHAGPLSPFALVQEIREWFDGPLLLSGSIANGGRHSRRPGHGRRHGLYRLALHRHRRSARRRRVQADDRRQRRPRTSSIPTTSPAFTATT
jgi:nitronate monooxygenase